MGSNSSVCNRLKSNRGAPEEIRSGQESASCTGISMEGNPSCASTAPSGSSTMEWTMLWGCTTAWIFSGSAENSQEASMTSSPLLKRVAESTVIFAPMSQFGCFSASRAVTRRALLLKTRGKDLRWRSESVFQRASRTNSRAPARLRNAPNRRGGSAPRPLRQAR